MTNDKRSPKSNMSFEKQKGSFIRSRLERDKDVVVNYDTKKRESKTR